MDYQNLHINVPWGQIVGRWYGNRNVRPILALHGWLDNIGTWDRLIPLLPKDIGILCVDFPGHGRSSIYPNGISYHMIDYVDIIILIIKEYKWNKVSLMGHSMGAIIALVYTSIYPEKVDMLIQLDIIMTPLRTPEQRINKLILSAEKFMIENERLEDLEFREPPSFSYEQLEEKQFVGSKKSIEMENCKHILNRNIEASELYPQKYYFSRDGRVKVYHEFNITLDVLQEMFKRFKDVNYLIVKYKSCTYLDLNMLEAARRCHPKMQFREVEGTHHAHLNNPKDVADTIVPFILSHRYMTSSDSPKVRSNL